MASAFSVWLGARGTMHGACSLLPTWELGGHRDLAGAMTVGGGAGAGCAEEPEEVSADAAEMSPRRGGFGGGNAAEEDSMESV